nr:hypothetical protein [Allopusillimonas soli]
MTPSKIIGDLVDSAIGAKAHYEIWWAQASEAKPHLLRVMNAHSDFFRASYNAHYTAFFVHFAHLFDPRPDSSSIPTYFSAIRATADPMVLAALEAEFENLFVRARPLVIARHKTVAHVDARLTEKDVFAPLKITWNEVRDIIYESVQFVAKLASSDSGSLGIPRDRRLIEVTLKMIRALDKSDI